MVENPGMVWFVRSCIKQTAVKSGLQGLCGKNKKSRGVALNQNRLPHFSQKRGCAGLREEGQPSRQCLAIKGEESEFVRYATRPDFKENPPDERRKVNKGGRSKPIRISTARSNAFHVGRLKRKWKKSTIWGGSKLRNHKVGLTQAREMAPQV